MIWFKLLALLSLCSICTSFSLSCCSIPRARVTNLGALSSDRYLENDLIAIQPARPKDSTKVSSSSSSSSSPRLCVVRADSTVAPLCRHEDDVETDLFLDPRCDKETFWSETTDDMVRGTYGEGWYGQRPVPSLGGGPGYGAEAQEIWSIDTTTLEQLLEEGVEVPFLDVGIAHGEKARGGAF